jgi:glycine dehydrogenase subunit 1
MSYYSPHTESEIRQMLAEIGVKDLDELFKSIPKNLRLKRGLDIPAGLSEAGVEAELERLSQKTGGRLVSFAGGGVYNHYVPRAVDYLLMRSEFTTAYTPYQPEASQGTLQAIFEYQTMMKELTGMEVANASMYDGGESTAEAVLMALRVMKKPVGPVLLSGGLHPHYQRVIETYTKHLPFERKQAPLDAAGRLDLEALKKENDGLCLVVQHPNYFGCLEDMDELARVVKEKNFTLVVIVCEALSLSVLEPPGSFGAAIVAGEAQSFGIRPGFGGPLLGFFASREEHMRKMPGRLIGETRDREGRRGFVLTLATREQHIRRAKATSNICTNHSMMALTATIYLSLLGKNGLAKLGRINLERGAYLRKRIEASKILKLKYNAPVFNEMTVSIGCDAEKAIAGLAREGVLAGVALKHHFPGMADCLLLAATEMTEKKDIDSLVEKLEALARKNK